MSGTYQIDACTDEWFLSWALSLVASQMTFCIFQPGYEYVQWWIIALLVYKTASHQLNKRWLKRLTGVHSTNDFPIVIQIGYKFVFNVILQVLQNVISLRHPARATTAIVVPWAKIRIDHFNTISMTEEWNLHRIRCVIQEWFVRVDSTYNNLLKHSRAKTGRSFFIVRMGWYMGN